jgi:hypothetical protein
VPLLTDAAQSAGTVPIDTDAWRLSAVTFTGHKSLFGPPGIGFPHRLKVGTANLPGIIGLVEGIDSEDTGAILDADFGIAVRTAEEIERTMEAVGAIAAAG